MCPKKPSDPILIGSDDNDDPPPPSPGAPQLRVLRGGRAQAEADVARALAALQARRGTTTNKKAA